MTAVQERDDGAVSVIRSFSYRLGLDLGASSLGWAAIQLDQPKGEPDAILATGVRIFEAGVEGDIEQGKDASRAVVRRQARQPRRQQWRRQWRKARLFALLQEYELLPSTEGNDSRSRKECLDTLDTEFSSRLIPDASHDAAQKLPYLLRERAAAQPVTACELGRALYHLAQRRGYLSNRKSQGNDEEEGQVLSAISEMDAELLRTGKTLGAYLNSETNPIEKRIRRRWLGRKHYHAEFKAIQAAQEKPHSQLTAEMWFQIEKAIFFQRPLKSQRHLIGRCELEFDRRGKGLKRCLLALPITQQFRILQKVNDLRVTSATRAGDPLTRAEREKLIVALQETGEMSWSKVKSLLKLGKQATFSLEEWDDKLIGNRTNSKMLSVFGPRWNEFSEDEQTAIVLEVVHYRNPEALKKRAINIWGLSDTAASQLAYKTRLEQDYASLSRQAMQKLIDGTPDVPGLKNGGAYSTIRKAIYPERFQTGKVFSKLPPVNSWKSDIRNPAVIRALTELRKVVNAVISKYGKPEHIHIELAREIRNSRKKRKDIHQQNMDNQKRRAKAVQEMLDEVPGFHARRRDIEKWLLADECNWACPYCGKVINRKALISTDAEFNVEHIYPRRYLDDSYLNKTVACRSCNDIKQDRTPAQAFHGTKLEEILQRVERLKGTARDLKLARFKAEEPDEGFVDRQLNDTRYNSRIAAEYLQLLYGGRSDASGEKRILCPTGQLTGKVRANWQLNDLLGEENSEKERDDHRHHAIDAVVIGLMTQKQIQALSEFASKGEKHHSRHFFDTIRWPWPSFKNDVAFAIASIHVSHRPTHTIAGPLHAETIYSPNLGTEKKPEHRVRRHLSKLTLKEISGDQIVDPRVRAAVQKAWNDAGRPLPTKLWGNDDDRDLFPRLLAEGETKGGSIIRKVRLRTDAKPRRVGKGVRERNYASGKDSNYASLIYAVLDKEGREVKWEHEILDRLSAHVQLSANHGSTGEKVLFPTETEKRRFKFAVRKNDILLVDGPDGKPLLYRVQKFSQNELQLCEHNLTTVTNDQRTPWNRISSIDNLRKRNARPVAVSPAGEVTEVR